MGFCLGLSVCVLWLSLPLACPFFLSNARAALVGPFVSGTGETLTSDHDRCVCSGCGCVFTADTERSCSCSLPAGTANTRTLALAVIVTPSLWLVVMLGASVTSTSAERGSVIRNGCYGNTALVSRTAHSVECRSAPGVSVGRWEGGDCFLNLLQTNSSLLESQIVTAPLQQRN